jgi:hypothetical protein
VGSITVLRLTKMVMFIVGVIQRPNIIKGNLDMETNSLRKSQNGLSLLRTVELLKLLVVATTRS